MNRDFYEAFALWVFFTLMVQYIGGERELMLKLDDGRQPTFHMFPFNWFLAPVDVGLGPASILPSSSSSSYSSSSPCRRCSHR